MLGAQATVPGEARGTCKLQQSIKRASPLHRIFSGPPDARLSAERVLVDIRQLKDPSLGGVIDRLTACLRLTIEYVGLMVQQIEEADQILDLFGAYPTVQFISVQDVERAKSRGETLRQLLDLAQALPAAAEFPPIIPPLAVPVVTFSGLLHSAREKLGLVSRAWRQFASQEIR